MKHFIKQRLREGLEYNHVVGDATEDNYEISEYTDLEPNVSDIKQELNSLPQVLKLYRVVYVNDPKDINTREIGSHYVMNRKDLERSHYQASHVDGGNPFMLTVKADKNLIDIKSTISNRVKYPHENEITLNRVGLGASIINVEPFHTDDDDLLGTPDDMEMEF